MPGRTSRRRLLAGAGAASVGVIAVGGAVAGNLAQRPAGRPPAAPPSPSPSPYGPHQSGITDPTAAANQLIALTLRPGVDAAALGRLLRLLTSDIEALMAGEPTPGDPARDLAQAGTGLRITVGFGPRVFDLDGLGHRRPEGLVEIPPMTHDRLRPAHSGGDLLLMVAADEATTVDHAARLLVRDADTFATPHWVQTGSWRGTDGAGNPVTGRNLFGQIDGTGNAPLGSRELSESLWSKETGDAGWFAGGTTLVVRRIEMNLDTWDQITRNEQQQAIGRRLDNGAPLAAVGIPPERAGEFDRPDFAARTGEGQLAIAADSHVRLAHPDNNAGRRILRRGLNYTETVHHDGAPPERSAGLVFLSYQADIATQYVPIQRSLDRADRLNDWTTAIGSAVFALPPGFQPGGWLGQGLLDRPEAAR